MKTFHISDITPIFYEVNTLSKECAGSPIGQSTNIILHIQVEKEAETERGLLLHHRGLCTL